MSAEEGYATRFIQKRGRRAVATLLTYMEERVWEHIPEELQEEARSKIMRTMGDFQDIATDMIAADVAIMNEFWVEQMGQLRDDLARYNRAG